jgi:hypothetical protein
MDRRDETDPSFSQVANTLDAIAVQREWRPRRELIAWAQRKRRKLEYKLLRCKKTNPALFKRPYSFIEVYRCIR